MSEQRQHHPFSPSKLASLEVCPCFESTGFTNEAAEAGTRKHTAVERGSDDNTLSDSDAWHVAQCLDIVEGFRTTMAQAGAVTEMSEEYLPIDDRGWFGPVWHGEGGYGHVWVRHTTAGYIDKCLVSANGEYAHLFDFKFGRWPVEPPQNNLQVWAYVLGLFRRVKTLTRIDASIIQPTQKTVTQTHAFSRDDIPRLELKITQVVARKQAANKAGDFKMANPTYPNCLFCARLAECTAVAGVVAQVGRKFHPLSVPEDITPSRIHDPKETSLGMRLARVVKVWADAFTSRTADRVMRGAAELPEDFEVHVQARRSIADSALCKEIALRYLSPEEYAATLEPTLTALEKAISAKAPRGDKKATVENFGQALLDAKAVDPGQPVAYLRAVPSEKNTEQKTTEQ